MNAPCKDCPDRVVEPNCHMTCERYKEYQSYRQDLIDSRKSSREYKDYKRVIQERVNKAYRNMAGCKRYRNRMN